MKEATTTDEAEEAIKRHPLIIGRFSVRRALFDVIMDILVAFSILSSLYFLGFHGTPDGGLFVVDQLVRFIFFLEIAFNFFTEITDDHGNGVSDFKEIAKNYGKGWLVPDVLAVLPYGFITGDWDIEYLIRMIRITKLPNALNMLDGRGFSLLISFIRDGGSREENQTVSFLMRYIG
jgi:hypothetical protein